jgi:hypothetical protein
MPSGYSHDDRRVVPTHIAQGNGATLRPTRVSPTTSVPAVYVNGLQGARGAAMTLRVMHEPCGVPACRS